MIRMLIIIITICLFSASCGVKDEPKYQLKISYNKKINIV